MPITNTTICNPWNTQAIDVKALRESYGIPNHEEFTPETWQDLIRDITKKESQELLFSKYLHCPGYEANFVQYHTTYVCMVDLFVHSKQCNPDPQPLCKRECDQFERTVADFVQDESVCPVYPRSKKMREIMRRREEILYGVEHCNFLFDSGVFSKKQSCLAGVDVDRTSCGFGGDLDMGSAYCKDHPKSQCCSYMRIKNETEIVVPKNETAAPVEAHWYDSMKRLVTYWSATDDIKQNNAHVRRKVGVIVLILFLLLIIGVVGYMMYGRLQARIELERNRRALYEETRSFNSKYTPVLGEE
jgi:hypothetical protein